jgi:hypothetical protein
MTKSNILRALGTLPFLGLLAATSSPAHAAELQVNGSSPFACASVQGGTTANGTPVILYSCGDGPPQQWNYNNGQLTGIGTANGVSTCLEANGSSPGSPVQLFACNGAQNQQWRFQANNIISVEANLCLDSSPGLFNELVVNTCSPAATQNWIVRGMEFQVNGSQPYSCFSVDGSLIANNTPVLAYSCDFGPAQQWYFDDGQIVGLGTNGTNTKCLTAAGTTSGSVVELSTCNSKGTQTWLMLPGTHIGLSASSLVQLGNSDLCVDSSGGPVIGGGTELVLHSCTAVASQNWIVR